MLSPVAALQDDGIFSPVAMDIDESCKSPVVECHTDENLPSRRVRSPLSSLTNSGSARRLPTDVSDGESGSPMHPPSPARKKALRRWPSSARWSSFAGPVSLEAGFSLGLPRLSAEASSDGGNGGGGGLEETSFQLGGGRVSRESSFQLDGGRVSRESSFRLAGGRTASISRESSLGLAEASAVSKMSRSSSIADMKMLFANVLCRTASFVAAPGTDLAFTFDAHFEWQQLLGSGSFADVYAVRHKLRRNERCVHSTAHGSSLSDLHFDLH